MRVSPFAMIFIFVSLVPVNGEEGISMFILSLTWPNGYCRDMPNCYEPPPQDFTIHGFWPQKPDGTNTEYCPSIVQFNCRVVETVRPLVSSHWPSLTWSKDDQNYYQSDSRFWRQQWGKHGTCSNMEPKQYFSVAVELKIKINLLHSLRQSGIIPGPTVRTPGDIKLAIQSKTGHLPILFCKTFGPRSTPVLREIRFCVDLPSRQVQRYEFISCPRRDSRTCNGDNTRIFFSAQQRHQPAVQYT